MHVKMMVRSHRREEPSKQLGVGVQAPKGLLEAGVKGMAGPSVPGGCGEPDVVGGAGGVCVIEVPATGTHNTCTGDKGDSRAQPQQGSYR